MLEEVYTTLIGLFSRFTPPEKDCIVSTPGRKKAGIFPALDTLRACGLTLTILEGLGGHQYGQIYLLCEQERLLFTADTMINFDYLSKERADYSSLAALLVDSVNVDSSVARVERHGILDLVKGIEQSAGAGTRPFLICGGHGPVSAVSDGKLVPSGISIRIGLPPGTRTSGNPEFFFSYGMTRNIELFPGNEADPLTKSFSESFN